MMAAPPPRENARGGFALPFSAAMRQSKTSLGFLPWLHFLQRLRMGRRVRINRVGNCVFFDDEVGRAVLNISDSGIDDGHIAAGIVTNPQTVAGVGPDSVVGNVHVLEADIGKCALTVLAPRSNNA